MCPDGGEIAVSRLLTQIDADLRVAQVNRKNARVALAGPNPSPSREALIESISILSERIDRLLAERSIASFERHLSAL